MSPKSRYPIGAIARGEGSPAIAYSAIEGELPTKAEFVPLGFVSRCNRPVEARLDARHML
jgi:hypothetical protein